MSSLSNYFRGSASKYLSSVDTVLKSSNQHEIGSNKFTAILGVPGSEKRRFNATFIGFDPITDEVESCTDTVTYYNTREGKPRAPEYRLYYRDNVVSERMSEGDFCLIALRTNGDLLIAIAPPDSDHERRLRHLFSVAHPDAAWQLNEPPSSAELDLARSSILEALGLDITDSADDLLGIIVERFGYRFPPTSSFSAFSREQCPADLSATADPDRAVETWMQWEEKLFRTLEKAIVESRLQAGFNSVDDFMDFSLSVQNRRKSRAGHALEHHLEAVFRANAISYERGKVTEGRSKPDFLFPGQKAYRDMAIGSPPLRMLAAKSSCKDRWRQILAEAARIPEKHLFTLETAISENQTDEMMTHRVKLVVPPSVALTYSSKQQDWLMTLRDFVSALKAGL